MTAHIRIAATSSTTSVTFNITTKYAATNIGRGNHSKYVIWLPSTKLCEHRLHNYWSYIAIDALM